MIGYAYLLMWSEYNHNDFGEVHHTAFTNYEMAMVEAHKRLIAQFGEAEKEQNFRIFDHKREGLDVLHFCGGVSLKLIPLISP